LLPISRFISITPEGFEPGTNKDTDFYYALIKQDTQAMILPPTTWAVLNKATSKHPVPTVTLLNPNQSPTEEELNTNNLSTSTLIINESDSDHESSSNIADDDGNDDSFNSITG
jgi:hypothetical protein